MEAMASLIPKLGLPVVGALCLDIEISLIWSLEGLSQDPAYQAMIPLS